MMNFLAAMINGAVASVFLAAAIWLVLLLVPRRAMNAATRYLVWWAALIATVALPLVYWPGRQVPHPVPSSATQQHLQRSAAPHTTLPPLRQTTQPVPPHAPGRPVERPSAQPPAALARQAEVHPSFRLPALPVRAVFSPWLLIIAWAATAALQLLRLLASYVLLARRSARACDALPHLSAKLYNWLTLSDCARKRVRLAISTEIAAPAAIGPRRPSILIPTHLLDNLQDDDLDRVGVHEAAHLARRDDYALLFQLILEAFFTWHPVIRWISRQIELEREIACDDFVIAAMGRARSYAACLTRVVELAGSPRSSLAAATMAENRSHLSRRVGILLDNTRHTGTRPLISRLALMIAFVAALAWGSGRIPALLAFAAPLSQGAPVQSAVLAPQPVQTAPPVERLESPPGDPAGLIVDDSSGNPVATAEVRFRQFAMRELAADLETDSQGRYSAPGLPPGDYTVRVSKPNYLETTFRLQAPGPAVLVRLVRYGVIDGQVTNTDGRPLPGRIAGPRGPTVGSARITVLAKATGSGRLLKVREAPLGDGGRYRIFDLPPGQYLVALWYANLNEGSDVQFYPDNANPRWFTVAGGEEYDDVNFLVVPRSSYKVSGKVSLPKPGTQFSLAVSLPEQPILPVAQTVTEADGSFSFAKVPSGTYDLLAAGPTGGYTAFDSVLGAGDPFFGRMRIQVSGQSLEGLDVPVAPGRSLKVGLRGAGSAALPEGCPKAATVALESLEPWGTMFTFTARVAFGEQQAIANLAPGRFRVSLRDLPAGCYQANEPVAELSGEPAEPAIVEFAAAGAIRGTLQTGAGRPASFAIVLLDSDAAAGGQPQLAIPDEQGRFHFDRLRPGQYRIAARPATAGSRTRWIQDAAAMTEVAVRGGAPTTVNLVTKGAQP